MTLDQITRNEEAQRAAFEASTYETVQFAGLTWQVSITELRETMNAIERKNGSKHWKDAVRVNGTASVRKIAVMCHALMFFHGAWPCVATQGNGQFRQYQIVSAGYAG